MQLKKINPPLHLKVFPMFLNCFVYFNVPHFGQEPDVFIPTDKQGHKRIRDGTRISEPQELPCRLSLLNNRTDQKGNNLFSALKLGLLRQELWLAGWKWNFFYLFCFHLIIAAAQKVIQKPSLILADQLRIASSMTALLWDCKELRLISFKWKLHKLSLMKTGPNLHINLNKSSQHVPLMVPCDSCLVFSVWKWK